MFFKSLWAILKTAKPMKVTDKELDELSRPPTNLPPATYEAGKADGRTYHGFRIDIPLPGGERRKEKND